MADLVPTDEIERVVGAERHEMRHLARAVSAEQVVYVLHSHHCKRSGIDLRACAFSLALDKGICERDWLDHEDCAVAVEIADGRLIPTAYTAPDLPGGDG